jgi:hypothetical protein
MRRTLTFIVALAAAASAAQSVFAVFFDDAAYYEKRNFCVNHVWPWPYQCPDRIAVREPFCQMISNGWRRQNLLGQHHFNPGTNELSTAGELRVQWIMTQAPPDRRGIFIERTLDSDVNAKRLAVVRDYAIKVSTDGRMPQVEDTYLVSEGRPAAVVDATNVSFMKSMPAPVLPAATNNSTSSSGQ